MENNELNEFKSPLTPFTPVPTQDDPFNLQFERKLNMYVIRKRYTDFSTAGTTNDVTIFELPNLVEITSIFMNVVTAFAGGAIASYTISVGNTGSYDTLLTAQSTASTGMKLAKGTDFTTNRPVYSVSAKTDIKARATSTGANLNAATAGIVDFYISTITFPGNA